ncbi:hypothetical protein LTR20_006162 [Exophiala xenobiotica]|nr:hypothetical protein LTS13_002869 [Exophiala xenobiotica]KAK5395864.1 hypothetical protein LTR79_006618 [Exophiala xenobiotica]KAK5406804.1 hypothetical protein LTR06_008298 [Exophiala xenobiotica]KAK5423818.1 hypothetical protein LTR90_001164 [Exophiala xenobiotica]KAK5462213.1 hypothetical protein LTR20_006162 [Exophiala xenobiotica]
MSVTMQAFAKQQFGDRTYTSLQSIVDDPVQALISSSAAIHSHRPMNGGLDDILSASRYPQALMEPYQGPTSDTRKNETTSSDQFYGGLVFTGPPTDSNHSSVEPEQSPTQKRKRAAKRASAGDAEDHPESKKQRGRPRLDTYDETAADRRRTQIRLAQRAYRNRKETTISALKQKVTDLQDTIDQMNKTFLTLHDNMVGAGILTSHYALGRQLQAATEEFVALAKITALESDDEDDKIAQITKGEADQSGTRNERRRSSNSMEAKTVSRPTKTTNVDQRSTSTDADAGLEELRLTNTSIDDNNTLFALSDTFYNDGSNLDGLHNLMSFNATVPEFAFSEESIYHKLPALERPLKAAYHQGNYTYSFQETTFARRLHRMCLERAFRYLTIPNISPDRIKHAFRFTFCFSNRKRMLQRFQEMLKRKAGESLENWNAPFFHIGGAGTHFPRRDDDGNPVYPPNMVSPAKAFGPQPFIEVETPRMEATTREMLENIGFGGEWYDSHDVEQYLKTKGIFLDGQSSFVELDPSVLTLVKASSRQSEASSSGFTPTEPSIRTPSPLLAGLGDSLAYPFATQDLSEMYTNTSTLHSISNKPASDDPWAEFTAAAQSSPGYTPTFQDMMGRKQTPVTFDVEAFLERMVDDSACLGRAPGFRKETIDNALVMSLQESF